MMEKKTSIRVPQAYVPLLEDLRLLAVDQNNPNRTRLKQQEQIWNRRISKEIESSLS